MPAVLTAYLDVYRLLLDRRAPLARFGGMLGGALVGFWALCTYGIGWSVAALPVAPQPWIYFLLGVWFSILLAVRWHRLVLLDERQAGLLDIWPGRREWWFLARFTLIVMAVGVFLYIIVSIVFFAAPLLLNTLVVLSSLSLDGGTSPIDATLVVEAVKFAAFSFGLARLGLILPAAAVERPLRARESWQATAGHALPFFALIVLVGLPAFIVESVLGLVAMPEIVSLPLYIAVWWVTIAATATALSFNYAAVIGRPDDTAPQPRLS